MAIERGNSFHLLLSDDELKLLRLLAEQEGLNPSDYLRMLIRTMPSASSHVVQGMRLGAMLGGRVDLAALWEAHTDTLKLAKGKVEKPKKKAK
jgi:ABC-type nitrate/sulfonate/bicarbonate transport system substrate-binding protein